MRTHCMVRHDEYRVLCVARVGLYAWLHNPAYARDKDNQRLLTLIRDTSSLGGGVYGYHRVHGAVSPILLISAPGRAGCIWRWLSLSSPVTWLAGR